EKLARGQDMEFSLRLKREGYRTLLVPEIVTHYYAPSGLRSFIKHSFINGLWVILPFRYTNITPVSLRHLIPLVFVLSLIGSGIVSFFFLLFKWIFLGIIFSYCLANVYFSAKIALRERNFSYLFLMPVAFAMLHISYGLGSGLGMIKLLLPTKRGML
ncbi:MAG: glycosyltransferase family 2 protein, partial [Candidatus Omnitrophota bacterium]|nr:glycosyltransferase family 2 protein [Candidatus Omnitrophota bacterium]